MKVKEYILYLFNLIPLFKWQIKEKYIPTVEEKSLMEQQVEQQKSAQEVINELMQVWNPQGYEDYQREQDLQDIKNISDGGVN